MSTTAVMAQRLRCGVGFSILHTLYLVLGGLGRLTLVEAGNTPIYLLGLYPLSGNWPGGQGQLPATRLGLEYVNSKDVLPGYELVLVTHDTEVRHLVKRFHRAVGTG